MVHDAVALLVDRGTELGAVGHTHDDRPTGQRPVVHSDDVGLGAFASSHRSHRRHSPLRQAVVDLVPPDLLLEPLDPRPRR